jgi:predicted DNA repair protein MutK
MPASSLLALIDDIASLLDDVALLSKVAAEKTAGVVGDDLALNANQVSGVHADRELPVVWAVAKGSLWNKVILVPAALAVSAFLPVAILPLLMIGGLYLCYEGFEKVWHRMFHAKTSDAHADDAAHLTVLTDPTVDVVAMEKERIKGAVRTDFILSAEIVVIALGTMSTRPIGQQIFALSFAAIGITVLVYGLVAAIVKLDDLGLRLYEGGGGDAPSFRRLLGGWILRGAPVMMKGIALVGTAAMFMVGGSIIAHAVPAIEHFVAGIGERLSSINGVLGTIGTTLIDGVIGIVAGGLVLAIVTVGGSLFRSMRARESANG